MLAPVVTALFVALSLGLSATGAEVQEPSRLLPLYHAVGGSEDILALPPGARAILGADLDDAAAAKIGARSPRSVTLEWSDDYATSPLTDATVQILTGNPELRHLELHWHRRLTPAAYRAIAASGVETLVIDQLSMTDAHLEALGGSQHLVRVEISFHNKVTPRGIFALLAAPALREFTIGGDLGADHLAAFAESDLRDLRIAITSDDGIAVFDGFRRPRHLELLGFDGSAIQDLPLSVVAARRPGAAQDDDDAGGGGLQGLSLSFCWSLADDTIADALGAMVDPTRVDVSFCAVGKKSSKTLAAMRSLTSLVVDGCSDLEAKALARTIAQNPLEVLSLDACAAVDAKVFGSIAKAGGLRRLSICGLGALDDKAFAKVSKLRDLEELYLSGAGAITDAGAKALARMKALRSLDLSRNSRITDKIVPTLVKMKALEQIDVSGTGLSAKGLGRLRAGLPKCDVVHNAALD